MRTAVRADRNGGTVVEIEGRINGGAYLSFAPHIAPAVPALRIFQAEKILAEARS